jgi:hypothetical protein
MRFALQDRLRSERFAFGKPFVTQSGEIREEMQRQLKAYRYVDKTTDQTTKRVLTGKGHGASWFCRELFLSVT